MCWASEKKTHTVIFHVTHQPCFQHSQHQPLVSIVWKGTLEILFRLPFCYLLLFSSEALKRHLKKLGITSTLANRSQINTRTLKPNLNDEQNLNTPNL